MFETTTRRFALLGVALTGLALVTGAESLRLAAAGAGGIDIQDAWARAAMAGGNSAVYMRLHNPGGTPERLVAASSDVAKTVELHETVQEGDRMTMRPVAAIDIAPGGHTALEPGGLHVMLIGLQRALKEGDSLALRLTFEQAGTVHLTVPVRKAGAMSHGHGQGQDEGQAADKSGHGKS